MNKSLTAVAFGALVALGTVAFSVSASAAIVCNDEGDCWHTSHKYTYPPAVKLSIHDDKWKWGDQDHDKWNEHTGRGYWKGNIWIGF
jgi:hypothetical protein